ncbi:hypothetical protein TNCV_390991 [Trichonephila clavipes]|nr:hypothetical protein TNCV_390991 [Trichonephila clavipes]
MSSFLGFCEGDTRNRWRDGQVCPDVDKELWRLGQTAWVCFGVLCANRTREVKRDFCDLPIRRSEGRAVNTPLVVKKGSFLRRRGGKRKRRREDREKKDKSVRGERTDGRRRRDGKEREETERD